MKFQVTFLLGYVAFATASTGYTHLVRKPPVQLPALSNLGAGAHGAPPNQPGASGAPPAASYAPEEPPLLRVQSTSPTEEPHSQVVYKSPVRVLQKQPIRVSTSGYGQDVEEAPAPFRVRGGVSVPLRSQQQQQQQQLEEDLDEEYASNAKYSFASAVDDGIMDQSQHREEQRDGKKVTGSYSYSDGYFMRTVQYEADENGYRVVGSTVEPIRETGPEVDLVNGRAEVLTQLHGVDTQYSVSADELAKATQRHNASLKQEVRGGY